MPQPFLGLGMAYNASGEFAEAIKSLKEYVKLEPGDPAGYYQLALAYSRTGNKQEAMRQMALQREAQKNWNGGPAFNSGNPSSKDDLLQPH